MIALSCFVNDTVDVKQRPAVVLGAVTGLGIEVSHEPWSLFLMLQVGISSFQHVLRSSESHRTVGTDLLD